MTTWRWVMGTGRRSMSATTRKGECPVCGQRVSLLNLTGKLYQHQWAGVLCPGSYGAPVSTRAGAR